MREVFIAGTGMSHFGKFPDSTIRSLSEQAVGEAMSDAKITASDVDIAYFGNGAAGIITGQEMIRGQVALRTSNLLGTPIVNVENACASSSTAFYLARMAVASGEAEVALAVGAEKLSHPDKAKSFGALGAAVDLLMVQDLMAALKSSSPKDHDGQSRSSEKNEGKGHSPFMDIYAAWAEEYMRLSGATQEDFARVVVKARHNASLNPKAQFRDEVTIDDVLASRAIAGPLTLFMCAPIGDGAAAIVVASEEWIRRHDLNPVRIRSCVLLSGRERKIDEPGVAARAAHLAFESAGIGPSDIDVVELHDAAAPAELATMEEIGLCATGEAPKLLGAGETGIGGRLPVNPSGGLLCRGHPIGATGCAQLVELADQLRGRCGARQVDGARIALAENGGGFLGTDAAAMVVTILER